MRTNLAEDTTIEDLLMIKLNLEKVEKREKMGGGSAGSGKRKIFSVEEDLEEEIKDNKVEVCLKKTKLEILELDSDSD